MLLVDKRERTLAEVLRQAEVEFVLQTLPVGDVMWQETGRCWIAERKRADDLAASIKSGRWSEQRARLQSSGSTIVYIIEGDLRGTSLNYHSLLGATVNETLREASAVFRTWDISETAHLLSHLVQKMGIDHQARSGIHPPQLISKRKREEDPTTCQLRMLMCIPSISENIGMALLKQFGTIAGLQEALRADEFPRVMVDARNSVGQRRQELLRSYLLVSPAIATVE